MPRTTRWLPALLAPLIVAGAITVPLVAANASPNLPDRSAAEIMASVSMANNLPGYSGTLHQDSNLGLPALPTMTGAGTSDTQSANAGADLLGLISSDQTVRVAVNREAGLRVQLLQAMGEQDLIINRENIWQWDNASQSATHVLLPQLDAAQSAQLERLHDRLSQRATPRYSPLQLSEALIQRLDAHTRVSVGESRYVAGQAAYTLVFTPRESATTVRDIQVSVDAKTGLPLRFGIYAKGQGAPAYELGYTSLNYTVPAPATFDFKAPAGTKVKTLDYTLPKLQGELERLRGQADDAAAAGDKPASTPQALTEALLPQLKDLPQPGVAGSGWASVITLPASDETRALVKDKTFLSITTALPNGDRAIQTTLVNARIHPDGSLSIGAVPLESLR
jgi:hypothetical protein